jgi:HEPN domain-containing protein
MAREHDYTTDAESWLQWADHTYGGARRLFHEGSILDWFPAAILGHQALEMYLKASLIRQGHRITKEDVWGHDLVGLASQISTKVPNFPIEITRDLQTFTDYFNELRYPANLKNVEGLGEGEGYLLDRLVQVLRPYAEKGMPQGAK